MSKFNVGVSPEIVVVFIPSMRKRHFQRGIRKLCKFFNVDVSLNDLLSIASYYGYVLGTSDKMMFVVAEGSGYGDMALTTPEILELSVKNDHDKNVVVVL